MISFSVSASGWECTGGAKYGCIRLWRGNEDIFIHGTPAEIKAFGMLIARSNEPETDEEHCGEAVDAKA